MRCDRVRHCLPRLQLAIRAGLAATPGRVDKYLRFQAKTVGDTGYVVEESNDLRGIVDGGVVEALGAQQIEIGGGHLLLVMRKFDGMGTEGVIGRLQRRAAPIAHQRMDERISRFAGFKLIGNLSTEVVGVGLRSVTTVQFDSHHRGQHLALRTRQR